MSRGTVEPTVRDMASAVTLWVEHRTLKSPLSRYKTCSNPAVCFEQRGNSLTLRCSISLSCTKEYLAVDSGGYMCLNTLHCVAAKNVPGEGEVVIARYICRGVMGRVLCTVPSRPTRWVLRNKNL